MPNKWTAAAIPDQSGRVALVTGANSGIGFETAKQLAAKGAIVIPACRNQAKAEEAAANIPGDTPVLLLDLSDLSSVREAAEQFKSSHDRLDLLINNAGVMAVPKRQETADGFELQFASNHLGHFALTGLLLDRLLATPDSRVVTVSSNLHGRGSIHIDDLQARDWYSPFGAYSQSKLANLLFAYELQRRFTGSGSQTLSLAAHPGWTRTGLQHGVTSWVSAVVAQRPPTGALPTLLAATGTDVKGGAYYGPRGFREMRGHPKRVDSSAASHDTAMAEKLWSASEELTGVTYDLSPANTPAE